MGLWYAGRDLHDETIAQYCGKKRVHFRVQPYMCLTAAGRPWLVFVLPMLREMPREGRTWWWCPASDAEPASGAADG